MNNNEEWLKLLSDEERAGVMKVQIAETEATKRKLVEEEEKTRRELSKSSEYQFVRGMLAFAAILAVMCATCVAHRAVEANQAIKMKDPSVVQGIVPPPPAK